MEQFELAHGQGPATLAVGLCGGIPAGEADVALALLAEGWNGPLLHLRSAGPATRADAGTILFDPADPAKGLDGVRAAAPAAAVLFAGREWTGLDLAYLCAVAGVPRRFGLEEEFAGAVLTDRIAVPKGGRDADRCAVLAEAVIERMSAAASAPGGSDVSGV